MIAKAKAIPHGHANLAYIMGESKKKEHAGEKIQFVTAHGLDLFHRSAEAWEEIKRACRDHPDMKNTVVQLILSPDKEDAKNFTIEDWKNLWEEYLEVFDTFDHRNDKGELISKPANCRNSIHTVSVHFDSKSGVPHLHGAVCRVDEDSQTNPDSNIHLRAQAAAEIINIRRGWKSPMRIREDELKKINDMCREILRRMPEYSLSSFHAHLRAAGYEVIAKPDSKGEFHGHSIKKGNCHYKMSEIGREFTISRLPETWRRLHKTETTKVKPVHSIFDKLANDTVKNMESSRTMPISIYSSSKPSYTPFEVTHDGKTLKYYLPKDVTEFFNYEFDSRDFVNADELTQTAISLFVGLMLPPEAPNVGTGGGGSSSDLPWGRDPKEDEIEWARRCAQMAKQIAKPQPRTKFRR